MLTMVLLVPVLISCSFMAGATDGQDTGFSEDQPYSRPAFPDVLDQGPPTHYGSETHKQTFTQISEILTDIADIIESHQNAARATTSFQPQRELSALSERKLPPFIARMLKDRRVLVDMKQRLNSEGNNNNNNDMKRSSGFLNNFNSERIAQSKRFSVINPPYTLAEAEALATKEGITPAMLLRIVGELYPSLRRRHGGSYNFIG